MKHKCKSFTFGRFCNGIENSRALHTYTLAVNFCFRAFDFISIDTARDSFAQGNRTRKESMKAKKKRYIKHESSWVSCPIESEFSKLLRIYRDSVRELQFFELLGSLPPSSERNNGRKVNIKKNSEWTTITYRLSFAFDVSLSLTRATFDFNGRRRGNFLLQVEARCAVFFRELIAICNWY